MGSKILLIDDDPEIFSIVKDLFGPEGYSIEVCVNGRDAIKTLQDCKPDLLLLDVMLPGVDGYSLALQITENEATRDLPIVVLSGLEPSGAMFQRFPQVTAFITKPFNPPDLLEAVRRALIKKP